MIMFDVGSVFATVLAMGAVPEGGNAWLQLIPFVLVLAIFYFIILLPMKRKQQKVTEFLEGLKVGDRVITTGGIHGQITRLGELTIQIQIADKVRVDVSKAAIGGYQGQAPVVEPQSSSS
jgi:preprotein translocase subunit YajC